MTNHIDQAEPKQTTNKWTPKSFSFSYFVSYENKFCIKINFGKCVSFQAWL